MKYMAPVSLMVVALFAFVLAGCASNSTDPTSNSTEPTGSGTPAAEDGHGDHDHGEHAHHDEGGQTDMEKMKAELAKLSPEDAASAEKQHVCPVTGDMLGTMGAPEKVVVNGQQVWICCDGCKDELLDNPDKYLAKLNR